MTNEQKQLLIKDLGARLPYKPKVFFSIIGNDEPEELSLTILRCLECIPLAQNEIVIKPYLRPMSSMTKEEEEEYELLIDCSDYTYFKTSDKVIDWLNAHHFDYRGLIPMGLALEAPEGMYKIE